MKKYNIGLDIGTTSVGWAVVECDTQKIIRKGKGKDRKALWGVRLFEEASTAEERRSFRSTRRRYERRRQRIKLLQEEFKNEINKVDSSFYTKIKESKYNEKDNVNKSILLTVDEKNKIKEYNEKYKTIYHLRNKLINNPEKEDIRLVYLAIHHIIKYRGNFNQKGDSFNVSNLNIKDKLKEVFTYLYNNNSTIELIDEFDDIVNYAKIEKIITSNIKNDIKVNLKEELSNIANNDFVSEFIKLIIGYSFTIKKLFNLEDVESKMSISFAGTDLEEKYNDIIDNFGEEVAEALIYLKELYDMVFIKIMFKDSEQASLSALMVERYNKHKSDLKDLKSIFDNDRKIYNKFFRTVETKNKKYVCIYDEYIHNKKSFADIKNELKKSLQEISDKNINLRNKCNAILEKIENDDFLPRITDKENGKYPYQLNKSELISIIENQGKYYPFLLEKVQNTYKLIKLLEFKIPYYVGPLVSSDKSDFAWMERRIENVKITPYNFDEVIDKEKTAEKFIKRMISHCSYLLSEYALPNNSILYSKYKVMNELKQIKINDSKLTLEQQNQIINEFFLNTSGSLTDSKFKKYLYSNSEFKMFGTDIKVTGYSSDNKFANNMQSYIDFFGINGIFNGTSYNEEDAEQIIEWITIFEDKDILENKIRNEYVELSEDKIKLLISKKYTGWGNLSKKLLTTTYYPDKKTGIKKSILDLMKETDENFMQIINNDEYKFQKMIKENNLIEDKKKLNYKNMVANLATSPANKKGIWQSLKVVKEIIDYMGYDPEYIVIEMARGEDNKKERKDDRVKYLLKLYNDAKDITYEYNKLTKDLKDYDKNNKKLDTEKLYLYYLQEGKCLYCAKSIDIENLNGTNYEIDHILPRTLIKDNSWDNKALVCRCHNQEKGSQLVLPYEIRNNEVTKKYWERLKKNGLISNKKMYRLTRKEYSDEDIQGFINRQLVETRQITKHVANIISNLYEKSKVIYIKSAYSHDYRMKYKLYKFREINDYHHAHDAYLAAVLGEYKEKYMKKNINFEFVKRMNSKLWELDKKKDLHYGYAINCLDKDVSDIVYEISSEMVDKETGEIKFDTERFNKVVEDTLYRNDILISKKTEIRSGTLYKQSIYAKGIGNIKLKENMPTEMYGGYLNVETSYLCLVKVKDKMKLIGIPMQIAKTEYRDPNIKVNYIKQHLKISNIDDFEIKLDKIPFESLYNHKGQEVYIKGYSTANKNCEISNAYQLKLNRDNMRKYSKLLHIILNNYSIEKLEDYTIEIAINEAIDFIRLLYEMKKKFPLFEREIEKVEESINLDNCTFEELSKIIIEILKMYHCNSSNANLKEFGLGDRMGRLSGVNIESNKFTFKSITGLKERKYEF